jgi:hypothetical protein
MDRCVLFMLKVSPSGTNPEKETPVSILEELGQRSVERMRVAGHLAVRKDHAAPVGRPWGQRAGRLRRAGDQQDITLSE